MTEARDGRVRMPPAALVAAGALAAVVLLVVVLAVGDQPLITLGARDPGLLVRVAGPLMRLAALAAGTVCLGSLVFAVAVAVPGQRGSLSARGWAAVRTAGRAATVWAVAALGTAWSTVAAFAGDAGAPIRLLQTSSVRDAWAVLAAAEEPVAWLLTAVLAAGVAVGCRLVLAWTPAAGLLLVAAVALLPSAATGHASSQAGHDLAIPALFGHVLAAAVWLGTLVAVVRPGWDRGPGAAAPAVVARRYALLATGCWVVIAGTGLVDAGVLLGRPGALVTTSYGWVVVATALVTAVLGVLGWRWRRRCLDHGRRARLAVGELVLLAATGGLSTASTVLVPPAWQQPVTALQTLLGYDLDGPPTPARLLLDWRIDMAFVPAAVLVAVLYVRAVRRLRRSGRSWPVGRTVAWLAGCAVIVLATSSGIGRYGMAMISVHMAAHMLLSTAAPVLLVLGAPIALLRQVTEPAGPDRPVRAVDVVDLLAASAVGRAATRPLPALAAFVAVPFVLYLTPLFDAAVRFRWAELIIDLVVLGTGLLFARVTVGATAGPPMWARVGLVLVAMPFGALFAVVLATTGRVVGDGAAGANMYGSLALPWLHGDLLGDQRVAAGVTLVLGEVLLLLALAVVLVRWERRQAGPADPAAAAVAAVAAARSGSATP